jgi:Suppressor of fused protein (SUFU)
VTELRSPGWQAIDDAMAALYRDLRPHHVGYQPPAAFSNNLQGCSAYAARGHWHYVTYGLSELYVPAPEDDPTISGWGFELTMRVPRAHQTGPPGWPFTMINEMAKHVKGNAVALEPGHRIDLRQAVTGFPSLPDAPSTGLTVFAVTADPELGTITTSNGRVTFLQLVGVTQAEKGQMVARSTAEVLAELSSADPLLVTDPGRA